MNWDQIEVKWAAMARRVRSDLPETTKAGLVKSPSVRAAAYPAGELPDVQAKKAAEVSAG
jgi:hypothetical protein